MPIGKSVIFSDYDVKINIDKFFGFHFAVFGNTGAGKSNTVARILQNIFAKKNYSAKGAKFVIIDSNGEYNKAFSKLNETNPQIRHSLMIADDINDKKFEIPVWALSADDWAILLHASEKTQIPVLKRAIDIAKIFYSNGENNNELKNLDEFCQAVEFATLYEGSISLKRRENKADMPINFLIEEAHRFVRNETSYGAVGYNIFERIAKEGRKYGMLLGISSQRPSELSKTVVSQCSNFIIHRVQNPDDLHYISKMVPYINQNMIGRLTYLQTGHALVFGSAINLPTLTKFTQAEPRTDSDNAQISEKWYIE